MKTSLILLTFSLIFLFSSCKEKKQPIPAPAPQPTVVKDTVKPEPVPEVKVEKPVRQEPQKYFLIAGCFEYKENATKLSEKLQQEGYDSRVIPYFENLYLVSYNGYPTRQEAVEALNKILTEKGKEKTWMYKLKN